MALADFTNMTKEQFLGTPQIITVSPGSLPRFAVAGLETTTLVPFLDKYRAKMGPQGCEVYDNGQLIATYRVNRGGHTTGLSVDPKYRGQGIAAEILYQNVINGWRTDGTQSAPRTTAVAAMMEKVWERIQKELGK